MPQRIENNDGFKALTNLRKTMEAQKNAEWYNSLTGRDLYEMETRNLMNQTVVDRPIRLALNNVTMNLSSGKGTAKDKKAYEIKSLDPVTVMTNCMVDGRVVIRIRTDWTDLEIEDDLLIKELKIDGEGYIEFIRFQYQKILASGKPGLWFRRDYQKMKMPLYNKEMEPTGKFLIVYQKVDWPEVKHEIDFEKIGPGQLTVTDIPYIPFVAAVWNTAQESFLIKKKRAFLELERVSIEISSENNKHSRRKLFVKAPVSTEREISDLGDDINHLPNTEGSDAFYPDPHAAVIEGFFKERKDQVEAIENATGVVATEKIVALSGVSRVTAMKSLVDLSQKIRKIFIDLMIAIEKLFIELEIDDRQLTILVPPLGMMIVDVNNQAVLLVQAKEEKTISDYEYRESMRQMLGL